MIQAHISIGCQNTKQWLEKVILALKFDDEINRVTLPVIIYADDVPQAGLAPKLYIYQVLADSDAVSAINLHIVHWHMLCSGNVGCPARWGDILMTVKKR